MDEHNARWIALLFDTEGSFSLTKGSADKAVRQPKRGFNWTLNAHVINTYKPLLEKAQAICGGMGRLSRHGSETYRQHLKIQYTWSLRREEMKFVLPEIIPHLMEKKERAELLLEATQLFGVCKGLGPNPVTPYRDRRLETIFWRMRTLNAKNREGQTNVKQEEEVSGHIPYPRENFSRDAERVRKGQDENNYQNKLKASREWKARNRKQMNNYYREWYAKRKAKLRAAGPAPASPDPPAPSAP